MNRDSKEQCLYLAIDDTDDIGTKGTGEIAEEIAQLIEAQGLGRTSMVTRHQLFVHDSIPYTSHNSAMCFQIFTAEPDPEAIRSLAIKHLLAESAPASDPGLALLSSDGREDWTPLVTYGLSAKRQVLTKTDAYSLAEELAVHLSEHGGTGDGVIGALAAIGLRMTGSDGRFKGRLKLPAAEGLWRVSDIIGQTTASAVVDLNGQCLSSDEEVYLSGKIKAVLLNHQQTLLVNRDDNDQWRNAGRQELKAY